MIEKEVRYLHYFLVSFLFLSLLISKPGIYFSSALVIIYGLYLSFTDQTWRNFIKKNIIIKTSIFLYIVGLLASFTYFNLSEIGIFARKAGFLLVFPVLTFIFSKNSTSRKVALVFFMLGLLVAFIESGRIISGITVTDLFKYRIDSFFDIGRWSEMLAYIIAFSVPFSHYSTSRTTRNLFYIIIIFSILFLLLTGSRGPWIATAIMLFIFTAIRNRKLLITLSIAIAISAISINITYPSIMGPLKERISSISDTQLNYSNLSRLVMWNKAIDFSYYNLKNEPYTFLFGTGVESISEKFKIYLDLENDLSSILKETRNQFSLSDHHNAFLDTLNKNGVVFTMGYLFLLFLLIRKSIHNIKFDAEHSDSILMLVGTFLLIGVFYSNAMEFQTLFLFSLIAVSYSKLVKINE